MTDPDGTAERTVVLLPDGRRLDVWLAGPAGGVPVVDHHGTPSCGMPDRYVVRSVEELGVRLVRPTRPGYAGSDPDPGRSVGDVAADVEAVLDHVGLDQVAVMGASGGGPHALATAALLPERVTAVASIAGVAPFGAPDLDFLAGMGQDNLDEFGAALTGEGPLREYLEGARPGLLAATPEQIVEEMATLLPDVDRAALSGEVGEDLAACMAAALAPGVEGWLEDDLAFTRPWGFEFGDVRVPTFVWQGDLDLMVPRAHGAWLAARLPHARAHLLPADGHLSIKAGRIRDILTELVRRQRGPEVGAPP